MSRDTQGIIVAAAILSIALNPVLLWAAKRAGQAKP
jgi:hypothetical protein